MDVPSDRAGDQIGLRLRDARASKGYSLEDLAIATGLTEAEITAVENGTSTDVHHVERIEHALGW
ncbi:helix-turn-helix transcriptional regulator [Rhizobium sp. P38BS-XIX]|uniref:helix-turn-helix domain-containing protein n=1 Tax=Rhizobium sp. P38BS-XIX TaxID=2726740 RepID=UPI0014563EF5|nr:helix-turn-helix transcriptional regulator [Rhizobium sp. P38BS-XIX]NLR97041.1 helix-turn-helix transcriptional regulator [Rhizobium sp. P38BS-XIX]